MKILRIEGENLASLYGPFSVNFSEAPLAHAGVFAICGPTGSGKSTLLDAMCLALYGRTPRLLGMRKGDLMIGEFSATEARSLLSRGTNHGFAAVEFESALGIFRAEWIVEKPKRALKDKTTKPADARLFQIHGPGQMTAVDLKNREIAEFIGLDFEQFTRTVLLAQGEFRKFLDSKGDERSQLLERLTATQVYAELGKAAFERQKAESLALQNLIQQLQGIHCLETEDRQTKSTELQAMRLRLQELRKLEQECQLALNWYQTVQDLRSRESKASIALEQVRQEEESHRLAFQDLADWERCEPLRHQYNEWLRIKSEAAALQESLPGLVKRTTDLQVQLESLEKENQAFQARKLSFQERQIHTEKELSLADSLDKEILRIRNELGNSQTESARIQNRLSTHLRELRTSHQKLHGLNAIQIQAKLAQLSLEKEQLRAAKESLEVYLRHRAVLHSSLAESSHALQELRHGLVRGTPCPVCGGLEHPATLHNPEQDLKVFAAQLKALEPQEQDLLAKQSFASALPGLEDQLREFLLQRKRQRPILRTLQRQILESEVQRKSLLQGNTAAFVRNQIRQDLLEIQTLELKIPTKLRDTLREHIETKTRLESSQARKQECETLLAQLQEGMAVQRTQLQLTEERGREILRIKAEQATLIRQSRDQISKDRSAHEGSLRSLQELLGKHLESPPKLEMPAAESQKISCAQEMNLLDKMERDLSRILEIDANNQVQVSALQEQRTLQSIREARWSRLSTLIGSAEGAKFRSFAQNITLRRLTALANEHLGRLHSRYKLQTWPNMELVIEDLDMGGEIRSTRSLSGGEGFLVSMALALGLSDMAGKQTRIGSLFIDEGFGTLDSETLQAVVSVLEELRQQGRMVGIISHVDSLARQLGASIQISPLGNGRSSLKVC